MEKNRIIVALALTGLLAFGAGCASKEAMTGKEQTDTGTSDGSISSAASEFVEKSEVADERAMPGSLLANRLIYFDFDKSAVHDEYKAVLSAHSTFMVADRSKAVVLQGHADERGSDEYNLALGQRRSDAVKEIMLVSGVLERQIETVSFGEARPRALGHNETAWDENRRVEIVYTDE